MIEKERGGGVGESARKDEKKRKESESGAAKKEGKRKGEARMRRARGQRAVLKRFQSRTL
jgi:hypothetical protein